MSKKQMLGIKYYFIKGQKQDIFEKKNTEDLSTEFKTGRDSRLESLIISSRKRYFM